MWSSTPRSRPWQGRFWTLARPYTVERRPSRRGWMPPKATPGPTWPYQCTLDKSQLAKGINSSHWSRWHLFVVKGFLVKVLSQNLNYILKLQGCGFQMCFTSLLSLLFSELHPLHVLSQCGVHHLSLPVTTHSKPFPGTEYFTMHSAHCRRSPASLLHCTLHSV